MPSMVGLLEQRELGARRRVDELRERQEWAIARSRVGEQTVFPTELAASA